MAAGKGKNARHLKKSLFTYGRRQEGAYEPRVPKSYPEMAERKRRKRKGRLLERVRLVEYIYVTGDERKKSRWGQRVGGVGEGVIDLNTRGRRKKRKKRNKLYKEVTILPFGGLHGSPK